jgi:hypothetical protein
VEAAERSSWDLATTGNIWFGNESAKILMMTIVNTFTRYLFYAPNQLTEPSPLDTSGQIF